MNYGKLILGIILTIFCTCYLNVIAHKPRIAIISFYDEGFKAIGQYSDMNKQAYANKHGYNFIVYHSTLDGTRPAAWSKILALQYNLSNYDWLFWSDADSLIMNNSILLESLIDPHYDLIITREATLGNINTGSFLIKNSDWSRKLLHDIYAQVSFIHAPCWEQDALMHLLHVNKSLFHRIKLLPQRMLNSHPGEPGGQYHRGDFVIHLYRNWGINHTNRVHLMQYWYYQSLQRKQ